LLAIVKIVKSLTVSKEQKMLKNLPPRHLISFLSCFSIVWQASLVILRIMKVFEIFYFKNYQKENSCNF